MDFNKDIDIIILKGNHDGDFLSPAKFTNFKNVQVIDYPIIKEINGINYIFIPHLDRKVIGDLTFSDF